MRAFHAIAPYAVVQRGRGYVLLLDGAVIEVGFPSEGDAIGYAHGLLDAEEDEAAWLADFGADEAREAA